MAPPGTSILADSAILGVRLCAAALQMSTLQVCSGCLIAEPSVGYFEGGQVVPVFFSLCFGQPSGHGLR